MELPRPEAGKNEVLGAGEIFVEFEDIAGASKGRQALAGRSFNGKAVKATFFPLDLFQVCSMNSNRDLNTCPRGVMLHSLYSIRLFRRFVGFSSSKFSFSFFSESVPGPNLFFFPKKYQQESTWPRSDCQ